MDVSATAITPKWNPTLPQRRGDKLFETSVSTNDPGTLYLDVARNLSPGGVGADLLSALPRESAILAGAMERGVVALPAALASQLLGALAGSGRLCQLGSQNRRGANDWRCLRGCSGWRDGG